MAMLAQSLDTAGQITKVNALVVCFALFIGAYIFDLLSKRNSADTFPLLEIFLQ